MESLQAMVNIIGIMVVISKVTSSTGFETGKGLGRKAQEAVIGTMGNTGTIRNGAKEPLYGLVAMFIKDNTKQI